MKDDTLYLIHINECISKIQSYVADRTYDQFINDLLIQDAVLRNLQVMSESTQRLSERFKENYPNIE